MQELTMNRGAQNYTAPLTHCLHKEERTFVQQPSLRLLVLTENFVPAKGGTITWMLNTYSRFDPQEIIVVTSTQEGDACIDQVFPFRVERIPVTMADWDPTVPASLVRYLRSMWHIYRHCHMHHIQQIHCAKVLPEGLIAWALRVFCGIPYLVYAHGEEILIAQSSRKLAWIVPRIYRGAAAVIANSRNTKKLLQDIGVEANRIHVIYPGVDPQSFCVSRKAAERIRQKHQLGMAPVLLTVGRMQRRKGQDMVIQAFPRIRQKIPQVKYVMVGAGEELASLTTLTQALGVQDSVVFAGSVPDQELAAYYAACDVFIMPNRQIGDDIEGFGIAYLEAGAAGKPVIGGKSGGTEDAIVDGVTGLRVNGNSSVEIANAVIYLLSIPDRAKAMGTRGRQRVENEFAWDAVVERTRRLATRMTEQGRSNGQ
jgi:phosphatidylinositol alpha-1,6-mannosyltransferase